MDAAQIQAYWPVLVSSVLFVVWFARLEAQVMSLKDSRREHNETTTARETVLWAKLDAMQAIILELTKEVATLKGVLQSKRD